MEKFEEHKMWNNLNIQERYEMWEKSWQELCQGKTQQDERDAELVAMFLEDLLSLDNEIFTD